MFLWTCPNCGSENELYDDDVYVGDIINCIDCDDLCVVTSIDVDDDTLEVEEY